MLDLIGVSKDRPCQLDALLRSIEKHCKIPHTVNITYRYTEDQYREGYEIVKKAHPNVRFKLRGDLKEDFQHFFDTTSNPYVGFTVDDIIWKHDFDEAFALEMMDQENALCLCLRLGSHTNHCYPVNQYSGVPRLIPVKDNLYKYDWTADDARHDFKFNMILDTSCYRRSEYLPYFKTLAPYSNPNEFEGMMYAGPCSNRPYTLVFDQAKLLNCVINRTQTVIDNRFSNIHDVKYLNEIFLQGYRIDIDPIRSINNNSCHYEVEMKFIKVGDNA